MATVAQPFALPLTDADREWIEAWRRAQTLTLDEMLEDGLRVVAESLASGEITGEQADLYMRVLMAHYVGALATEQINGYLDEVWGMREKSRPTRDERGRSADWMRALFA